jgi:carotenoid cleavage dioxygenase-like enzyme
VVLAEVPVDKPRYMHSFGMTERYVVLAEFPLTVSLWSLALSGGGPFIEAYDWEPERGTRFTVIDKGTGEIVARPVAEPFFAFHHVNAFERGGEVGDAGDADAAGAGAGSADEIVVDVAAYDDASVIDALYLDELMTPESSLPGGELRRYRVPLDGGEVTSTDDAGEWAVERETVYEGTVELPRINYPEYNARDYRHVYGVGNRERPPEDFPNRLLKVDVATGDAAVWEEDGCYPGEPVFVASPGAAADGGSAGAADADGTGDGGDAEVRDEDDGVVLSVVLDAEEETSFLLCLDAASYEERARAAVPQAVPFGFHGQFWR